jgi:hypothetical protein
VALFENQNSTDKGKMTAYLRPVDPDFHSSPPMIRKAFY